LELQKSREAVEAAERLEKIEGAEEGPRKAEEEGRGPLEAEEEGEDAVYCKQAALKGQAILFRLLSLVKPSLDLAVVVEPPQLCQQL
jgi:hypothetical protein